MNYSVILFDGECNLCNKSVQFIIRHDIRKRFRFASLQSKMARTVIQNIDNKQGNLDSVILVENDTIYTLSDAALRIACKLDGWWFLLYSFIVFPRFFRNAVYKYIAKNRYLWFGKRDACLLPTAELRERFLEF